MFYQTTPKLYLMLLEINRMLKKKQKGISAPRSLNGVIKRIEFLFKAADMIEQFPVEIPERLEFLKGRKDELIVLLTHFVKKSEMSKPFDVKTAIAKSKELLDFYKELMEDQKLRKAITGLIKKVPRPSSQKKAKDESTGDLLKFLNEIKTLLSVRIPVIEGGKHFFDGFTWGEVRAVLRNFKEIGEFTSADKNKLLYMDELFRGSAFQPDNDYAIFTSGLRVSTWATIGNYLQSKFRDAEIVKKFARGLLLYGEAYERIVEKLDGVILHFKKFDV